jgi:hypothetical protein
MWHADRRIGSICCVVPSRVCTQSNHINHLVPIQVGGTYTRRGHRYALRGAVVHYARRILQLICWTLERAKRYQYGLCHTGSVHPSPEVQY